mmetsp:Transcript_97046/g.274247  ORF Transcript_97046/g.274247 Transcript_97046/m.274247 type:complete len:201 (+) Transcript_97046:845-1447(+)
MSNVTAPPRKHHPLKSSGATTSTILPRILKLTLLPRIGKSTTEHATQNFARMSSTACRRSNVMAFPKKAAHMIAQSSGCIKPASSNPFGMERARAYMPKHVPTINNVSSTSQPEKTGRRCSTKRGPGCLPMPTKKDTEYEASFDSNILTRMRTTTIVIFTPVPALEGVTKLRIAPNMVKAIVASTGAAKNMRLGNILCCR